MIQIKKAKDLMEDVHIEEYGVINLLTAGTTNRSRKGKKNNGESANITREMKTDKDVALITDNPSGRETALLCTEICKSTRIADSGASSHMTNTLQGMYNQCKISSKVKIGSREYVDANLIGDVSVIAIQEDGTKKDITICNVKYKSCLFCKSISLTTIMNKGFKMIGNGNRITIEKASTSYAFDQCIKSGDGELIRLDIELGKIEYANLHIGSLHANLGHPSNHLTNLKAEKMELKRIHVEATCESCIKAKQKQKNVPKYADFKAEKLRGKVFFSE